MRGLMSYVIRSVVLVALVATPGFAAPPPGPPAVSQLYDDFKAKTFDADKWNGVYFGDFGAALESVREVSVGKLHMRMRATGDNSGDTLAGAGNRMFLTNPGPIIGLQADLKVSAFTSIGCTAVVNQSFADAVMVAGVFATDDLAVCPAGNCLVFAILYADRASDSVDPANTVRVFARLRAASEVFLGPDIDLGTVKKGATTTFRVVWDQPNSQVFFQSEKVTANFPYVLSATNTLLAPFASLETNTYPANCVTGDPGLAEMDASWDKVYLLFQPTGL